MLQGLTPDDTLARLFGVLEALESIGLALGGIALSILAVQTNVPTAFAVVGGAGIVGLVAMWPRLASIDRARRAIDPELLRIARSTAVFSPLPPLRNRAGDERHGARTLRQRTDPHGEGRRR